MPHFSDFRYSLHILFNSTYTMFHFSGMAERIQCNCNRFAWKWGPDLEQGTCLSQNCPYNNLGWIAFPKVMNSEAEMAQCFPYCPSKHVSSDSSIVVNKQKVMMPSSTENQNNKNSKLLFPFYARQQFKSKTLISDQYHFPRHVIHPIINPRLVQTLDIFNRAIFGHHSLKCSPTFSNCW